MSRLEKFWLKHPWMGRLLFYLLFPLLVLEVIYRLLVDFFRNIKPFLRPEIEEWRKMKKYYLECSDKYRQENKHA